MLLSPGSAAVEVKVGFPLTVVNLIDTIWLKKLLVAQRVVFSDIQNAGMDKNVNITPLMVSTV